MTVSRLTMNSMEILSESEQLFITKYNKYFYKVRRFYYKVLHDRGRHANPYRKFNFAIISEKNVIPISLHTDFFSPLQAYDKGDIFPIWGECLGLELLSMLVAGRDLRVGQLDHEFFSEVDAKNVSLKLILPRSW